MKIKGILTIVSLLGISGAFAQAVEYDDMYFNAEDRANLKAQRATEMAYNTPSKTKKQLEFSEEEDVNPTDTYSARNVNPEYTSRSHSQSAQADEEDYFVSNYQHNRNELSNWNNDFNDWYSNPWYRSNFYGPGIDSWNSPYYGYNSLNSPWYDPYWSYNGWSSSFSYHYGSRWNYGWGGNYNYWNRPYYGWDPYGGSPHYGGMNWYAGGYWNNYRYPGTVIVNRGESDGRRVVYGKRPARGTNVVAEHNNVKSRSNTMINDVRSNASGRMRSTNAKQEAYYSRYNQAQRNSSSTYNNTRSTQNNRSRSWGGNNDNYSPSGRTSSPSYSAPSRSSGSYNNSGSSGTGTNGRSRGTN